MSGTAALVLALIAAQGGALMRLPTAAGVFAGLWLLLRAACSEA
jgi:hypothetical protein